MITLSNAKRFLGLSDLSVSIVGNGTIATATAPDHGIKIGDQVEIKYTTSYNGVYTVLSRTAQTFTFAKAGVNTTESGLITPHDFKLELILDSVTGFINRYTACRWVSNETLTETLDCPDDGVMTSLKRPITSISSLLISVERDFVTAGKFETLTAADYFLYQDEGKLELKGSKAETIFGTRKTVKVTYTTGEIPRELIKAGYDLLRYYYQIENDKATNLLSRSNQGDQVIFEKQIPKFITEQLDSFVQVKIGDFARSPRPISF